MRRNKDIIERLEKLSSHEKRISLIEEEINQLSIELKTES